MSVMPTTQACTPSYLEDGGRMNTASSTPVWAAEQVQGESRKFIESLSQGKRLGYNSVAENCLA